MDKNNLEKAKVFALLLSTLFIQYFSVVNLNAKEVRKMKNQNDEDVIITIIYDNNSYRADLKTGWGFSCLIQGLEKTILFDTGGDGGLLMRNLNKLSIDPNIVEIVVLSHYHADHTGGLYSFLEINPEVTIFIPQSFPEDFTQDVNEYGAEVVEVGQSLEICRNVYSTGELGTGIKEQSLIIKTDKGSLIITGCAHPGIIQIVAKSKNLIKKNILLVMGGFHLRDKDRDAVGSIFSNLEYLGVQYIGPCHCTGDLARTIFKEEFGEYYIEVGVGKIICLREL